MDEEEAYERVRSASVRAGYGWFLEPNDLNVFGVRSPSQADAFNDRIGIARVDGRGHRRCAWWVATTDPGAAPVAQPKRKDGTACLVDKLHPRIWQLGFHRGRYQALTQRPGAVVEVWRGADRTRTWTNASGINLHHASRTQSNKVGWWSEGCQVLWDPADLVRLLAIHKTQVDAGLGDVVSYKLLTVDKWADLAPFLTTTNAG